MPSNSYTLPEVGSYNSNNPATRNQSLAVQQQHQQMQQQHQQRQQQQAAFNSFGYGQQPYASTSGSSTSLANPPPVHYSTRGRSNTLTQELPPSLQKFGHNLGIHAETGQSVTPV